jgi:1,4-alpha-glucan branching enzyme
MSDRDRPGYLLGEVDLHLFNEGTHARLYEKLGAHVCTEDGERGVRFSVWAPNAERVGVIGSWNGWDDRETQLAAVGSSGIWSGFFPRIGPGDHYKFRIQTRATGYRVDKADPFGFQQEMPPRTASRVVSLDYAWNDAEWMRARGKKQSHGAPIAIYEVHLGSWARVPEEGNRSLTYREIAPRLADHVLALGFTHVELLPVMEHPFYGSWGYQVTGYFAPTSRYGEPQDLMALIDHLHQRGIGVILDWVPAHFPSDEHGLAYFDGTYLFEHEDPRQGFHPDWKSSIFNYERNEVRAFLLSSARFWLDRYHADGLRVDGVASMLYLDYSRQPGEWIPNELGGRENLGAISLLRTMNEIVYRDFPDAQTYAEESTAWPGVSRPTYIGGLGFGFKWDMGWMHDTLRYLARDPVHRKFHQTEITFRSLYAYDESFVLPLSHDEVVHGKGSLLNKMAGDAWQKRANLRLLFAYMFAMPGKKMLFMGGEVGQWAEWNHDESIDWHLARDPAHAGIQRCLSHLARCYREVPALHERDHRPEGFEWLDANDVENSVLSFFRWDAARAQPVLCVFNFTPTPRERYRLGVDRPGVWRELVNTDAEEYGGSGMGNFGSLTAGDDVHHGRAHSLVATLPPLAALYLSPE